MQVLLVTGAATVSTALAIYLPYDKAPVPFGDPLAGTVTSAAIAVFTVPGYKPTNRDAVSLSIAGGGAGNTLSTGGLATTMAQVNVTYYVCSASASAETFSLTTNKAAGSDYPVATLSTGGGYLLTGQLFVHLLSNQVDGTTIPFKPGNTVVALQWRHQHRVEQQRQPTSSVVGFARPEYHARHWHVRRAPRPQRLGCDGDVQRRCDPAVGSVEL